MRQSITTILLIISFIVVIPVQAQSATLWGPGEGYEIDYLHSGRLSVDNEVKMDFENEPKTEFTIENITNVAYNYVYIGYGEVQTNGFVEIRSFDLPDDSTVYFPVGNMPVALPLSFGDSEDWIADFHRTIQNFQDIGVDNEFLKANSSLDQDYFELNLELNFNGSFNTNQALFNLPELNFEELTGSYVNGSIETMVIYKRDTGVLYQLSLSINSEEYIDADSSYLGPVEMYQQLDFVAIIPNPSSALHINIEFIALTTLFILTVVFRKRF